MQLSLMLIQDTDHGIGILVRKPEFSIGRDPRCDLALSSRIVSRWHAVLLLREGKVLVRDLGSRNGTYVNGQLIEGECELRQDDCLRVGTVEYRVQIDSHSGHLETELADDSDITSPVCDALYQVSCPGPAEYQLWAARAAYVQMARRSL
jgi:predicted component of type VI protein secretion system